MRQNSVRPTLESLENRLVPATFDFNPSSATVIVTGTESPFSDTIVISHDGHGFVRISDGDGADFERDDVEKVIVNANGGVDVVRYQLTDTMVEDMEIVVNLGGGQDRFTGTLNRDIFGYLAIRVYGGDMDDLITLYGTPAAPARANDHLTDGLAINTNGLRVATDGKLVADLNGNDGNDRMFFDYEGDLDGTIKSFLDGDAGADVVSTIMNLRDGSTGSVGDNTSASRVTGSTGNDNLTFHIFDFSQAQVDVRAEINGGEDAWWPFDFDNDVGRRTTNVVNTGGIEVAIINT